MNCRRVFLSTFLGVFLVLETFPVPGMDAAAGEETSSERKETEKAMKMTERALKRYPDDPILQYNLGTLSYQRGNYEKAADSLSQALPTANIPLQGKISYNLGNSLYRQGHSKEKAEPDQAIRFYQQALENYRMAIRNDPNDRDAKINYELTQKRLQKLQSQQNQAKGQSDQQQKTKQETGQEREQKQPDEQQKQEQQSQERKEEAGEMKKEQELSPQEGSQQDGAPLDQKEMSKQEATWILDALRQQELAMPQERRREPAKDQEVERDW